MPAITQEEWLSKLRFGSYYKIANRGKRYSAMRKSRQKAMGGNTAIEVADRLGLSRNIVKKIENGVVGEDTDALNTLIEDLGITLEKFDGNAAPPVVDDLMTAAPGPAIPPAERPRRPKQDTVITKKVREDLTIVNHTTESFVIKVQGTELHLLYDDKKNIKKGTWIAPADQKGGDLFVARKTELKMKYGG